MALERDVQRIALRLFRALDTPRSLAAALLLQHGEWGQLVTLSVDPLHYRKDVFHSDLDKIRRDRQATDLLRKCQNIDAVDKKARKLAAEEAFLLCEHKCYMQNRFLSDWFSVSDGGITTPHGAPTSMKILAKILTRARKWIAKTLGGLPDFLDGKFGPGAVFESSGFDKRLKGFGLTTYDKIANTPAATPGLSPALEDHLVWSTALSGAWGAVALNRVIPRVRGNKFTTVPKDAVKDRGIAVEPGLNVWGQLAVGSELKKRLRKRGLLHANAKDHHCRMAMVASRDGSHATLDLSNASDTICLSLVQLLLPEVWFSLLCELRCESTRFRGKWVKLEKFSSMGNGFTFELETLIFASLAHACGARIGTDSSVYGDDTIVPTDVAQMVSRVFTLCGFTINEKKSYTRGLFRESCGGDFFDGADIRPFTIEEQPHDPMSWISLHNQLADFIERFTMLECQPVLRSIVDQLPSGVRCFGPRRLGDLVLHGPMHLWTTKSVDGILRVRCVVPQPMKKKLGRYLPVVHLTAAVLGLPSGGMSPRDSVGGFRLQWLPKT